MKTVYIKVIGKVQGVFFRASARDQAESLGLTGWIKNSADYVEGVISGAPDKVDDFIAWAHRGPERAEVERVEVRETADENFDKFRVIRGS